MDISSILTTLQQGTQALNAIAQALLKLVPFAPTGGFGAGTSGQMSAQTLVLAGFVRVTGVSVTTAGVAGSLNDSATVAAAGAGNVVYVVPATVGYIAVNMVFANGLVYTPGAAQIATIFYSRV